MILSLVLCLFSGWSAAAGVSFYAPVPARWTKPLASFIQSPAFSRLEADAALLSSIKGIDLNEPAARAALSPIIAQLESQGYGPARFSKQGPEEQKEIFETAVLIAQGRVEKEAARLVKRASSLDPDSPALPAAFAELRKLRARFAPYLGVASRARLEEAHDSAQAGLSGGRQERIAAVMEGGAAALGGPKKRGLPSAPEDTTTPHDIFRARFGESEEYNLLKKAANLEGHLNGAIFGQPEATRLFHTKLINYLKTFEERTKEPNFVVLTGLPGIGKSDLPIQSAEHVGLPIKTISFQNYTGNDEKVPESFAGALSTARDEFGDKPGILVLDELDKVYEIDEEGKEVDRPVVGILNQILNSGKLEYGGEYRRYNSDFSKIFIVVTSNFRPDIYGDLEAHPDLTSIRDLRRMHEDVGERLVDIGEALGKMFRQNTVTRLLPQTLVMRPLDEKAYRKLIDKQVGLAISRLLPPENRKAMSMKVTRDFRDMLFREAVLPATGARLTIARVGDLVEAAFTAALLQLQAPLAYRPVKLLLDYDASSGEVVMTVQASKGPGTRPTKSVTRFAPQLSFEVVPIPSDEKIPEDRLLLATHETGHAFAHVRYGVPFELMRVLPISHHIGGFVKSMTEDFETGRQMYAQLLTMLASRAMERIVYSPEPKDPKASYPHVTGGSSSDLMQATELALKMIGAFGLDPAFGPVARWRKLHLEHEMTQPIPEPMYERARILLNHMEQFLVEDFLAAHPREWYLRVIPRVARAGRLTEEAFYQLIGYPYHHQAHSFHEPDRTQPFAGSAIPKASKETEKLRQSRTRTTPRENLDKALSSVLGLGSDDQ